MNRTTHLLATGTSYQTEYHVLKADTEGPVCMVTAGVHGNEIAAPLAAKHFPSLHLKKGTLIVVPIVNKPAFQSGIRGIPDLNRTFPKTKNGVCNHPLATQLLELALRFRPTMCLDLHEGWGFHQVNKAAFGQTIITNPSSSLLTRVHRIIDKMNATIKNHVHQFSTRLSVLPGSFRTAMTKIIGVPTVTVETSTRLQLPVRIQYQEKIVYYFLQDIGLI